MTGNVIIVGAPRSGTNMLRDVLTSLPGFTTWPCDEINLIWKHGNRAYPSDELRPEHARPEVKAYLRSAFARMGRSRNAHTVVEKTCATSLRVEFAANVFPDARYVFIYRDGIDAAASAMRRWNAPFDLRYTAKKARYIPLSDVPFYARSSVTRVASNLRRRPAATGVTRGSPAGSWWGPRMDDASILHATHPLDELALIQWKRCVDGALLGLSRLDPEQVACVQYERFVASPVDELRRVAEFLGCADLAPSADLSGISTSSVGKGRSSFGAEAVARLEALAHGTLKRLGYV